MPATTKDHNNNENQNSSDNGRKITSTTTKPPEQGVKCPRCDSPNTKFCYYNNYSLTQPRHFCKTCRRYWTKGGALRNVPIGGGCRKNKKGMKPSSSSSSSSFSSRALSCGDSRDSGGSTSDILQLGGLSKLLHGLSNPLDFNLGGLSFPAPSRLQQQQQQQFQLPIATGFYNYNNNHNNSNQFCSFGDGSASSSSGGFQLDPSSLVGGSSSNNLIGLNFPAFPSSSSGISGFGGAIQQGLNSLNVHSTLASSIESLSSLNQDLHWKLQQQRLGMLFGGDNQNQKQDNNNINNSVLFSAVNNNNNNNNDDDVNTLENQTVVVQRPQPILFQNLEISKPLLPSSSEINLVGGGFPISTTVGGDSSCRREGTINDTTTTTTTAPTEWFFGSSSYGSVAPTPTPTSTSSGGGGINGHDIAGSSNNWVGGALAWGDVQQPYTALP